MSIKIFLFCLKSHMWTLQTLWFFEKEVLSKILVRSSNSVLPQSCGRLISDESVWASRRSIQIILLNNKEGKSANKRYPNSYKYISYFFWSSSAGELAIAADHLHRRLQLRLHHPPWLRMQAVSRIKLFIFFIVQFQLKHAFYDNVTSSVYRSSELRKIWIVK